MIIVGDVWFAKFPLEEDNSKYIDRPVIVLDAVRLEVLVVKVTKNAPRSYKISSFNRYLFLGFPFFLGLGCRQVQPSPEL